MSEEGKITIDSGVSWLLAKMQDYATDRLEFLKEGIADGVPLEEYAAMVGRYKEAKRWKQFVIEDIFAEFQQAEESQLEDEGLAEMPDDD